ncbi:hypothetical protein [Christiangramia forsetii]|uniref:Uncharacterized protein n=2 Tax=Christiangramia forsetii TaxID=411153 RepID=A0LYU2_CHRFK|nr:hypothetical protein [Christiangramia forsetii]GGG33369.1 hypothetical protein GCM10011532_16250 [Christiangramia forsetii]CAL65537.1 hypothetical protein GFO_0554 [Christiangramia forsetii KT0803]
MSTTEIKQELHKIVDSGDAKFVKMFYEMAKAYMEQLEKDKMILEGEEDIIAGRTYSIREAKKMLGS